MHGESLCRGLGGMGSGSCLWGNKRKKLKQWACFEPQSIDVSSLGVRRRRGGGYMPSICSACSNLECAFMLYLPAESRADTWQYSGHATIVGSPQEQPLLTHLILESPQAAAGQAGVPPWVRGRVASQTGLKQAQVKSEKAVLVPCYRLPQGCCVTQTRLSERMNQ